MTSPLLAKDGYTVAQAGTLPDDWDDLAGLEGDPFMSRAWLDAWWLTFGHGDPEVWTVRRDGRLVAGLPLRRIGRRLADWSSSPNDPSIRPLAPQVPEAASLLADAVTERRFARMHMGRSIPVNDPACTAFTKGFEGRCWVIVDRFDEEPLVETTGEFDQYLSSVSRSVRTRLGKHRRRLERDHQTRIEVLVPPQDVGAEINETLTLEASGWKGARGTATLYFPRETALIRLAGGAFHERGQLFLSRLWVDEGLAAVDLAVMYGNRVWSLITSYDEALGRYSPGLLLRIALIENCFEREIEANELLGTVLPWKRWFMTSTRPVCAVEAYARRSPTSLGWLAYRKWALPVANRIGDVPALRGAWNTVKRRRMAGARR